MVQMLACLGSCSGGMQARVTTQGSHEAAAGQEERPEQEQELEETDGVETTVESTEECRVQLQTGSEEQHHVQRRSQDQR